MLSAGAGPRRWIATLDCLVVAAALLALVIWLTGGFSITVAYIAIRAHESARTLAAALILLTLRLLVSHSRGPFGVSAGWLARTRTRLYRDDGEETQRGLTWSQLAWGGLALCAFGAALLWPQLRRMDSVPDLGDPLFSIWRIGWVFHQIQGDPRPLFSPNIFYPQPLALTFSDSMLLPSITAVPLLAAGIHPVITYNILFVSSFVLSGLAMFALTAHLTGSIRAAFIAALLFGFYPYRVQHHSHLELQMTYWIPLALLAWHRFLARLQMHQAVVAALCTVGLLYSCMYYAVFFVVYSIPVLGTWLLLRRRSAGRVAAGFAVAAAIGATLAVPLAKPFFGAQGVKGERPIEAVAGYSAIPSDYVHAHWRSLLYGKYLRSQHSERELFPGVMALSLGAAAFIPPAGPAVVAYGAGLLYAFDGSLGVNGLSYPWLYRSSTVVRGLRVPARFAVMLAISLCVLAAFSVRRLLARIRTRSRQNLLFSLLIMMIALDLWPTLPVEPVWPSPPPIYSPVAGSTRAVLAEFPIRAHIGNFTEALPFMYFSLWHWANMIDGYSGFTPVRYDDVVKRAEQFPDPEGMDALVSEGVTHVTVNCALYFDRDVCGQILAQADLSPRLRLLRRAEWQGAEARLYKLAP